MSLYDEELAEQFAEDARKRDERIANDPNNGKVGWWRVVGYRHTLAVRASSAREALNKADKWDSRGEWQDAAPSFWTDELPEVFSI